ncbi:hypothetical protein U9M48_038246, partial [Paspalum notatum var. saurae]
MATPAASAGATEVSVQMPAASADAAAGCSKLQQRERALNRFVRVVAFGEWAGDAFGALAFVWATGVLLGGFCSDLHPRDFWFAAVIVFIEAFRIFSRNYRVDSQWLFGTTKSLRWINVSFARMLGQPQEGNEVVLVMVLALAFGSVVAVWPPALSIGNHQNHQVVTPSSFISAFTLVVLSFGSLQSPAAAKNLFVGCWIDVILHILFLWYFVLITPVFVFQVLFEDPRLSTFLTAGITSVLLVAVLLIENLQIPAAAAEVLLSSWRLHNLLSADHYPLQNENDSVSRNLVPAIKAFYVLALCQGSLYIAASILGLFSFFPRRLLVFQSRFNGQQQQGAKAIDLYYEHAYTTCMETGLFAARKKMGLAHFAVDNLGSNSDEKRLAGVLVLGNLLRQREADYPNQDMRSRIIMSDKKLSKLVGMLGWVDVRYRDIRLTAAHVIANLADSLTIAEVPGVLKSVSSLLDAYNQPARNEKGRQHEETLVQTASGNGGNAGSQHADEQLENTQDNNGGYCGYRMKQRWSILAEELPLTHQESLPILGMVILERLAYDPHNCAEIVGATYLISKIIRLINYSEESESSSVVYPSLNFVRRLAITGENIGASLRQELSKNPFLLNNLECVLEDSRSSPEVMNLVIDILDKLALDENGRKQIGTSKETICKLMHTFIGWDEATNTYCYNQTTLRMAAGEALANLTIESPEICLAILEEPGYELIRDLKNMLSEDEYRYVAASLLQNFCAHSDDKLRLQGAGHHLSAAFPIVSPSIGTKRILTNWQVMENIMSAGGKQLEPLIGLIPKICDVIQEPSVLELQLQTNGSRLVQKLVDTLNSNRKPNPEYPRMRRAVVELLISVLESCPHYAPIIGGGMMEALTKVERTPSEVEKYRVFYGNIGIVPDSGPPLTALVAKAK